MMAIFRAFQGVAAKKHCTVLGVDHKLLRASTNGLCKKMNKAKLGETPNNSTIRVFHELHVAIRRHCQSLSVRGIAGYGQGQSSLAHGPRAVQRAAFPYRYTIASNRSKICTLHQLPPDLSVYAVLSSRAASWVCAMCFCALS